MKNALITGGSRGIGRAIALQFAKQGLNVAICSRSAKDLEDTTTELFAANPQIKVAAQQADVSDKAQLLAFAAFAEQQLGSINVLVNNAGMFIPSLTVLDADDTFSKLIDTNLMPAYELYRYFGKKAKSGGLEHIFNISSVAARFPSVNAGTYSVTKAAMTSLNSVMKLEMQQYGIKVTAVHPGSTLTSSWQGTSVDQSRFVLPEDIASAIIAIYTMSAGANVDEITITPLHGQL